MKKKYILIATLLLGSASLYANDNSISHVCKIENILENVSVKVKVTNNDLAVEGATVSILSAGQIVGTALTDSKGVCSVIVNNFNGEAVDIKVELVNYQTIVLKGALIENDSFFPIKTQKMIEGLQAVRTISVENSVSEIEEKSKKYG